MMANPRSLIFFVIVTIVVFIIYYICYYRHINASVAGGTVSRKRMTDIPSALRAVIFLVLVFYAVVITMAYQGSRSRIETENRNSFSVISLPDYTYSAFDSGLVGSDASYMKNYSKDANEGYKKIISADEKFTFTLFTRTGEHDKFHPDFFCFVDYMGKRDDDISLYENYEYINRLTGEKLGGVGSGGAIPPAGFLVVGSLNESDSLIITLSILNSKAEEAWLRDDEQAWQEGKGEFPPVSDYALSTGRIEISLQD